jgi:hypothetical protein
MGCTETCSGKLQVEMTKGLPVESGPEDEKDDGTEQDS